jgi:hypothetical protein
MELRQLHYNFCRDIARDAWSLTAGGLSKRLRTKKNVKVIVKNGPFAPYPRANGYGY